MANQPTPFRSPDPSARLDALEARIVKIEDEEQRDTLGRWIFRTAFMLLGVALVGAFVVWSVVSIKSCEVEQAKAPTAAQRQRTAAQRQRAADERVCEGIDGEYVQRMDDSHVCNDHGQIVIFKKFTNAQGFDDLEVIRR